MDVHYFFRRRVGFLRQLYENSSRPFLERKQQIEAGEEPFKTPYPDVSQPPFLAEWIEAEESLHVLGYACLSMLATALHLYFQAWERHCGVVAAQHCKSEFKDGWIAGYKVYFRQVIGIDLACGPCDLKLLEEVVLARNRIQHPDNLVMHLPTYSASDLRKLPSAFFIDPCCEAISEPENRERQWIMPPTLHVTADKLDAAISQVEQLVEWLDALLEQKVYRGDT